MRCIYALIVMLALPVAALGEQLPDDGVSAPAVAAALISAGYPADVTTNRSGDPLLRSSTGKVLFYVHFYQCGAQLRCSSIQFTAPFRHKSMTPSMIALWNEEKRFGRAFLDRSGIAWVAMDVEASRGMTSEALEANIRRWITVMGMFGSFAGR